MSDKGDVGGPIDRAPVVALEEQGESADERPQDKSKVGEAAEPAIVQKALHVYGPSDEDYYDDDLEDEVHEPQSGRRAFAGTPPPLERYRNDNIAPLAKTGRRGAQGPRLNKAVAHLVRPFDESYDWLELHGLACTIVASREDEDLAVDTALELARETTDNGQSCILIALRGDVDAIESADPSHGIL